MDSSNSPALLVVHGVGHVDETKVTADLRSAFQRTGFSVSEIAFYNWDQLVDSLYSRPVRAGSGHTLTNLRFLAEVNLGVLGSAHCGFIKGAGERTSTATRFFLAVQALVAMAPFWFAYQIFWHTRFTVILFPPLAALAMATLALLLPLTLSRVLANCRRFALIVLWPFIHLVGFSLQLGILLGLLLLFLFTIVLYSLGLPEANIENALWSPYYPVIAKMLFFLVFRVLQLSFVASLVYLLLAIIEPLLKVLADILRYIGLRHYRVLVQRGFEDALQQLQDRGANTIVILAHSLGSVIVADVLRRLTPAPSLKRLSLVTMGSPLQRLLFRFFQPVYSSPAAISRQLQAAWPAFAWLNVFRTFDPIGGAIAADGLENLPTHQWWRLAAHTNYWGDTRVANLIAQRLAELPPPNDKAAIHSLLQATDDWSACNFDGQYPRIFGRMWSKREKAVPLLMLGWFLLCFAVFASIFKPGRPGLLKEHSNLVEWLQVLLAACFATIPAHRAVRSFFLSFLGIASPFPQASLVSRLPTFERRAAGRLLATLLISASVVWIGIWFGITQHHGWRRAATIAFPARQLVPTEGGWCAAAGAHLTCFSLEGWQEYHRGILALRPTSYLSLASLAPGGRFAAVAAVPGIRVVDLLSGTTKDTISVAGGVHWLAIDASGTLVAYSTFVQPRQAQNLLARQPRAQKTHGQPESVMDMIMENLGAGGGWFWTLTHVGAAQPLVRERLVDYSYSRVAFNTRSDLLVVSWDYAHHFAEIITPGTGRIVRRRSLLRLPEPTDIDGVALSADTKFVAVVDSHSDMYVCEFGGSCKRNAWTTDREIKCAISFGFDTRFLGTACAGGPVRIWEWRRRALFQWPDDWSTYPVLPVTSETGH